MYNLRSDCRKISARRKRKGAKKVCRTKKFLEEFGKGRLGKKI